MSRREQQNRLVINSLVLTQLLLENFEEMAEEGIFVNRPKQVLKNAIPIFEKYLELTFGSKTLSKEDLSLGGTVITELSRKVRDALDYEDIMPISTRKEILRDLIDKTALFPAQKDELYKAVLNSEILNYALK